MPSQSSIQIIIKKQVKQILPIIVLLGQLVVTLIFFRQKFIDIGHQILKENVQ